MTHIEMTCPHCQSELRVRHQYVGLQVACKYCGEAFLVQEGKPGPESAAAPHAPPESPPQADARLAELQTEITHVRETLSQVTAERDRANNELGQLAAERDRVASAQAEIESHLDQAQKQIAELREQLSQAQQQLRATEQAATQADYRWAAERMEMQQSIRQDASSMPDATLQADLEAARQALDELRNERDAASKELETSHGNERELVARCAQLERQLNESAQTHRVEIARLNEALKLAEERTTSDDRPPTSNEHASRESGKSSPTGPLTPTDSSVADRLADAEQRIAELTGQLRTAQYKNDELRSMVRGLGITVR